MLIINFFLVKIVNFFKFYFIFVSQGGFVNVVQMKYFGTKWLLEVLKLFICFVLTLYVYGVKCLYTINTNFYESFYTIYFHCKYGWPFTSVSTSNRKFYVNWKVLYLPKNCKNKSMSTYMLELQPIYLETWNLKIKQKKKPETFNKDSQQTFNFKQFLNAKKRVSFFCCFQMLFIKVFLQSFIFYHKSQQTYTKKYLELILYEVEPTLTLKMQKYCYSITKCMHIYRNNIQRS